MIVVPSGLFLALYAVPLSHALLLHRVVRERSALIVARSGALCSAAACALLIAKQQRAGAPLYASIALPSLHVTWRFLLDARSAPFLAASALFLCVSTLGARRRHTSRASIMGFQAALTWLFTAGDPGTLACAFVMLLAPLYALLRAGTTAPERALLRRLFALYFGSGVLALLAFCALLGAAPFRTSLLALDAASVPGDALSWAVGALVLTAWTRMAIVPFHGWLPALLARSGFQAAALLSALHTGAYLVVRLSPRLPASPWPHWLTGVLLASAAYGVLLALGQRDLRRLVGCSLVTRSSLMLASLLRHPDALWPWLGVSAGALGVACMVEALGARTGEFDMRELSARPLRLPMLRSASLMFALVGAAPVLGMAWTAPAVLAVLALDALVLARAVAKSFSGTRGGSTNPEGLVDLLARERAVVGLLAAALALSTFWPTVGDIVQARRAPHVEVELARARAHHHERTTLSNERRGGPADDSREP